MTQRIFTANDQSAFAKLSGDFNPLHLDPVLSRRLLFGRQVVHGIHALLWSLNDHLKSCTQSKELLTVKANFQAGIGVGQTVRCLILQQDECQVAFQLEADSRPTAWIEITWAAMHHQTRRGLPKISADSKNCRRRSVDELSTASGTVALYLDDELTGKLFPNLVRMLPPMQLAILLATTRLVGMECPGYNSIYSSLNLIFHPDNAGLPNLDYHVTGCNQNLALVTMDVNAPGGKGQVKAFLRPDPQLQAAFSDVRRVVDSDEFSKQRALIVGGSRGLGEVSAKLLAAGGAAVILTYYRGEQDAQRIVEEIVSQGADAACLALNVLEPSQAQALSSKIDDPTTPLYLYYYATPPIFEAVKGKFSPSLFNTFKDYYVTGFLRTVQTLVDRQQGLQKVLYPSSIAIEELPLDMGEYAAAKMAGETVCDFLQKAYPGLAIHKPRLPRIATDQTVSLLPVNNQDPLSVIIENLRYLRQM